MLSVKTTIGQCISCAPNSSLSKTLSYVYKEYGVKNGLYRGLSLNYIRCIPSQAVAFTTYEFMKQLLHLN